MHRLSCFGGTERVLYLFAIFCVFFYVFFGIASGFLRLRSRKRGEIFDGLQLCFLDIRSGFRIGI